MCLHLPKAEEGGRAEVYSQGQVPPYPSKERHIATNSRPSLSCNSNNVMFSCRASPRQARSSTRQEGPYWRRRKSTGCR